MTLTADTARGIVRLTLPTRASARRAEAFLKSRTAWLTERVAAFPAAMAYAPGAAIPFGDDVMTLWLVEGAGRSARREEGALVLGGPPELFAGRVERWFRRRAQKVMLDDSVELAAAAGMDLTGWRVRVRDTKRQWGSCSSKGTLSFSWRLVHAPVFVRRGIVAHELAHIAHRNHSAAFHREVDRILGTSPRPAYDWLKREGAQLHWIGRE
jgi:predicted metal-dependent hydrolase